jgi:hypothetical protein
MSHPPTYFEAQSLARCGAHALNNLLGARAFEPGELDALAVEAAAFASGAGAGLPFALSMRTPVLGNYDVSVLELALSRQHAGRCADRFETARYHPTVLQRLPEDAAAYPGCAGACGGCGGGGGDNDAIGGSCIGSGDSAPGSGGGASSARSAAASSSGASAGGGAAASNASCGAVAGSPAPGVLLGFLVNRASASLFGLASSLLGARHWVCVRPGAGDAGLAEWWLLDSASGGPELKGGLADAEKFLGEERKAGASVIEVWRGARRPYVEG